MCLESHICRHRCYCSPSLALTRGSFCMRAYACVCCHLCLHAESCNTYPTTLLLCISRGAWPCGTYPPSGHWQGLSHPGICRVFDSFGFEQAIEIGAGGRVEISRGQGAASDASRDTGDMIAVELQTVTGLNCVFKRQLQDLMHCPRDFKGDTRSCCHHHQPPPLYIPSTNTPHQHTYSSTTQA